MTCEANGWSCPGCQDCEMETRSQSWALLCALNLPERSEDPSALERAVEEALGESQS